MQYHARFFGLIGMNLEVSPGEPITFELPDPASYGDLLDIIGARFGSLFPPNVWNAETRSFHPQVVAMGDGRSLASAGRETPLARDGTATFFVPIAGG